MVLATEEFTIIGHFTGQRNFVARATEFRSLVEGFEHFMFVKRRFGFHHQTVEFLKPFGNKISLLQCTTSYPTAPRQWGLNVIPELKQRFGLPVGFSDHSGDIFAGLAALSHGAELLEFHVVFDKGMFGPDVKSSMTIPQIKRLVEGIRQTEEAMAHPIDKEDNSQFAELKGIFEKSLAVNRDLEEGHVLTFEDLEAKKPANVGIPASQFRKVIGRRLSCTKEGYAFLKEEDLI